MRYYILGSDGQTYGPVEIDGLKQWAAEGRVVAATVIRDEVAGVYLRADQIPDLAPYLAAASAPVAQPVTAVSVACPNCKLPVPIGQPVCPRCGSGLFAPPERRITGVRSLDVILGILTAAAIAVATCGLLLIGIPHLAGILIFVPIVVPLVLFATLSRTYRAYANGVLTGCFLIPIVGGGLLAFAAARAVTDLFKNFRCFG